jgi:hypothetical protein
MHEHGAHTSAWPLLVQLVFISPCIHVKDTIRFYMPRECKPVIAGFYYGLGKITSANDFLKCMFHEMQVAEELKLCTTFIQHYIGDGPSRQFIKGIPTSGAICGCERCGEPGARVQKANLVDEKTGKQVKGHVAIIKTRDLPLRTQENYLDGKMYQNKFPDPENLLYKYSLKTNGAFNIIHSIPLDPMHTLYHCALNWIFDRTWVNGKTTAAGKLSANVLQNIEQRLRQVAGALPYTIKSGVGTKDFKKFGVNWSCAEKRVFFLYVAIVIFKDEDDDRMDKEAYNLLLALHHAAMLCSGSGHCSEINEEALRKAEEHFVWVIEQCQHLYGNNFP